MEDYSIYEESIDSEVGSYASFEGKEILVIDDRDGDYEEFRAVVSGCDYDIGISIEVVTEEEKQHVKYIYDTTEPYLCCLNGPSTKGYEETIVGKYNFYDEMFQLNFGEIKNGVMRMSTSMELIEKYYKSTSFMEMAECSFK